MSKFKINDEQVYRESQLVNLHSFISKIEWNNLNFSGTTKIEKEGKLTTKNVKTYFYGDFDVIDNDCILHPEKPHKESFMYLPSYLIRGSYADYLIKKLSNYKFIVKSGYPSLDFKYPNTVEVLINIKANLHADEKFVYCDYDGYFGDAVIHAQKRLLEQLQFLNSISGFGYTIRQSEKKDYIYVFSKTLPDGSDPLFSFIFGPVESLEIMNINGLQVDSKTHK
jgi:hypothetical protein